MNQTNLAYLNFTLSHILNVRDRVVAEPATSDQIASARAWQTAVEICERAAKQFSIDLSYDHPHWDDVPDSVFDRYVRTVFDTIRRTAADAEREAQIASGDEDVYDVYSSNLRQALSIMQTHARSLKLGSEIVDLDGYDPVRSDLATYRTQAE